MLIVRDQCARARGPDGDAEQCEISYYVERGCLAGASGNIRDNSVRVPDSKVFHIIIINIIMTRAVFVLETLVTPLRDVCSLFFYIEYSVTLLLTVREQYRLDNVLKSFYCD